jgi:hypothetical protein
MEPTNKGGEKLKANLRPGPLVNGSPDRLAFDRIATKAIATAAAASASHTVTHPLGDVCR